MKIRNKQTGEIKEIDPAQVGDYGITIPPTPTPNTTPNTTPTTQPMTVNNAQFSQPTYTGAAYNPSNDKPFLQTASEGVAGFFAPRLKHFMDVVKGSEGLNANNTANNNLIESSAKRTQSLIEEANKTTDITKKTQLLEEAKNTMVKTQNTVSTAIPDAKTATGMNDKEISDSTAHPYLYAGNQGLGVGGEVGSYMVPQSKLFKGAGAIPKIANAAATGFEIGTIHGATDPTKTNIKDRATQAVKEGTVGAGTSAAVTGAMQAYGALKQPLENTSNAVAKTQYNLSPKDSERLNLTDTVKALKEYGYVNVNDVKKAAPLITGVDGEITGLTRKAVANSSPVDIGGIDSITQNLLDEEPLINENTANKTLAMIKKGIQTTSGEANITGGDPTSTFNFIQKLESKASGLSQRTSSDEAKALGSVYRQVAYELKDRLFAGTNAEGAAIAGAGADNALVKDIITPEVIDRIKKINPLLAEKVSQVNTVGELRSLAAPFVRGSQAIDITAARTGNKLLSLSDLLLGGGGMVGLGPVGGLGGVVVNKALNTDTGKTIISKGIQKIANSAGSAANAEVGNAVPLMAIKGVNALGAPSLPDNTNNTSNTTQQQTTNNTNNSTHTPIIPQTDSNSSIFAQPEPDKKTTATGHTVEEHATAMSNALKAGDINGYNQIKKLMDTEIAYQQDQQKLNPKMSTQGKIKLANANAAEALVGTLSDMYHNIKPNPITGQRSGQLTGTMKELGVKAKLDKEAALYDAFVKGNIEAIARGISGQVGIMRKEEREAALQMFPTMYDPPEIAEAKIQGLLNQIKMQKQAASLSTGDMPDTSTPTNFSTGTQIFAQ